MEWRRLTQPEEPAFGRAMALYEASFPRHEQRLPDEQRAVLSHPEYHFIQLFDGAEFVGLLLYWEAEDFRYVEHFCVRPELRGRRYGAKALEELGRDWRMLFEPFFYLNRIEDQWTISPGGGRASTSGAASPSTPIPTSIPPTGRSTRAMSWWCSPAPGR